MFKIKFNSRNQMWDFIDANKLSNYSASNSTFEVELNEKYHDKTALSDAAKSFGGKLV